MLKTNSLKGNISVYFLKLRTVNFFNKLKDANKISSVEKLQLLDVMKPGRITNVVS